MVVDMSQRIAPVAGANVGFGHGTVLALFSNHRLLTLAGLAIELNKPAPDEIHNLGNPEAEGQAAENMKQISEIRHLLRES